MRCLKLRSGMVDMADGDSVVGAKPSKSTATTVVEQLAARAGVSTNGRPRISRAMSQQRRDFAEPPMPQKFVRLVGWHNPNAGHRR